MRRFPVITLVVLALAAAVAASPQAASALVYDRNKILSGELWRIITCNWVHFSGSHLIYNLVAFGIAGSLIELRGHRGLGSLCFPSAALIGGVVLLTQPNVQIFGGLSGLATAATVFLCLHGLRERGPWRWICVAALTATVLKITCEFTTGNLLFAHSEAIPIEPLPESHIAGAFGAIISWFCSRTVSAVDLPETRAGRALRPN